MHATISSSARAALTEVWADRMPITTALGITVLALDASHLALAMPLDPNRNHKGTVFAGSLSALATLAGWSVVWLLVREAGLTAHVVIQDAEIQYLQPTTSDVTATVAMPDPARWQEALDTFDRRGRARLALSVTLHDATAKVVATFNGRYVLQERLD